MPEAGIDRTSPSERALLREAEHVLKELAGGRTMGPAVTAVNPRAKRLLAEKLKPYLERCRDANVSYRTMVETLRYRAGFDVCERTLRRVLEPEKTR
jgi:hypothetical protein